MRARWSALQLVHLTSACCLCPLKLHPCICTAASPHACLCLPHSTPLRPCASLLALGRYLRYATLDVLEPLWSRMEHSVRRAKSVDDVIRLHSGFLETALHSLLLTQPQITGIVCVLTDLASTFSFEVGKRLCDLVWQAEA